MPAVKKNTSEGLQDFCQWTYCRSLSDLIYIGLGVCREHWAKHCEYDRPWESPLGKKIVERGDGDKIGYQRGEVHNGSHT